MTFAALFPGIAVAPIAGALLDRHGRTRLILLDYTVELVALVLIGGLALAHALPAPLLLLIATIASFTSILSATVASLFPIMVPRYLWDGSTRSISNGYVVATIVGPPVAAGLVALLGGPAALIVIGLTFGLAALPLIGVPDPSPRIAAGGRLVVDAWHGVVYWWRNRTLRGLSFSVTVLNVAFGIQTILLPLIVLDVLGGGELAVGLVFALSGVSGMVSAFSFGRLDSRGREWRMLIVPMLLMAPAYALIVPVAGGSVSVAVGFGLLALSALVLGFLNGPMDIALFTVRQRRTDPAWMGRAFAVSMAANFLGYPIGAAIGGTLAAQSLPGAAVLGVVLILVGVVLGAVMVPRRDPDERPGRLTDVPGRWPHRPRVPPPTPAALPKSGADRAPYDRAQTDRPRRRAGLAPARRSRAERRHRRGGQLSGQGFALPQLPRDGGRDHGRRRRPRSREVFSIGKSYKGRDIWIAEVTGHVSVDAPKPEVLVDALHHAREHLTTEQALYLLKVLTTQIRVRFDGPPARRQPRDLDRLRGQPRRHAVRPHRQPVPRLAQEPPAEQRDDASAPTSTATTATTGAAATARRPRRARSPTADRDRSRRPKPGRCATSWRAGSIDGASRSGSTSRSTRTAS